MLVWDNQPIKSDVPIRLEGWLKVPILREQPGLEMIGEPLGFTALRVAVVTKCAPGAKPIFSHCGGPGSHNNCHLADIFESTKHLVIDGVYDNFAITQRGIKAGVGDWKQVPFMQDTPYGVKRVEGFPAIACYDFVSGYAFRAVKAAYEAANLTSQWETVAAKLNMAFRSPYPLTFMEMDSDLVQFWGEAVAAVGLECRQVPDYQLGTNVVRGQMVYQDFMGTYDLSHDLDDLRVAIGAERLSVWGISYGTEVGAAYASIFPTNVDKLILDGNVAISSEIYGAAELWCLSYSETWNGLSEACSGDFFQKIGPTGTVENAVDPKSMCAATPFPSQQLLAALDKDGDGIYDDLVEASILANMLSATMESTIGNGIDPAGSIMFACVKSWVETGGFDGEGCCFTPRTGNPNFSLESVMADPRPDDRSISDVRNVRAVDMQGRLNAPSLAALWGRLVKKYPFGFMRATNLLNLATATNLPRPVPPYGSSLDHLTPLIIGAYGDPATTYTAAQVMYTNFKNGVLMSWQGYKHGLPVSGDLSDRTSAGFHSAGYGAQDCTDRIAKYLETGEHPPNGYVCPINGPGANSLSWDNAIHAVAEENACLN